jgi:tetratricopeptide (TPR) repeat protein
MFRQAVALDPNFTEAQLNVAQLVLSFRKYDEAEQAFRAVLGHEGLSKDEKYDATIGLGVAVRGQKKIDEAAKLYDDAMKLEGDRGDAYYNLGLLWKDFKTDSPDPKVNRASFAKAKGYFNQFLTKQDITADARDEAKDNIDSCDKNITALDQAIQAMANAPPEPPPTPASQPAPGPAPAPAPAPAPHK